ncbi:OB-fold nucleic acid binding domain-containing protein [Aldersonia sp. NBC_00410]|uniref:OB-fold nucleic acid binding domain-containing protein n=1 Tax=Aldersonia sp. NBC_00410 TaxID=2975954 RepID=UPI002256501D|nr:OB-fold nucleic acid binding domain-containing protein [Aldersonia sp. NBC_00410]MCX5042560.1 OB-fold nucleic acid binding domain-containing protein [Aldersonia sp. NBC_00410]
MSTAATGYFRRLTRRLTEDLAERDAEEMAETAGASGAQHACDCSRGDEVTMLGRLRSVDACSKSAGASMQAEFFDGTDTVTLVWIGRRRIPGIEPGRKLMVRGRVGERDGAKVIFNPYYELQGNA